MELYILAGAVVSLASTLAWIVIKVTVMIRSERPLFAVGGFEWRLRGGDLAARPNAKVHPTSCAEAQHRPNEGWNANTQLNHANEDAASSPLAKSGRNRRLPSISEFEWSTERSCTPVALASQGGADGPSTSAENAASSRSPGTAEICVGISGADYRVRGEASQDVASREPMGSGSSIGMGTSGHPSDLRATVSMANEVEQRIAAEFDDYCAGIVSLDDFQAVLDVMYDQVRFAIAVGTVDELDAWRADEMISWSARWIVDQKLRS